jgi:putative endopeptidase
MTDSLTRPMSQTTADSAPAEWGADGAVRPQDDLFLAVNGGWLETAQIPDDQSTTGAFIVLRDEAEAACRALVEEAADGEAAVGEAAQLIGDLYRSFLDTDRIEQLGLEPFQAQLDAVTAISTVEELLGVLGRFERDGIPGLFRSYIDTDPAQPDRYVLNLLQGGLGLPDEAFYREDQYVAIREAYAEHHAAMFALGGAAVPTAASASAVLSLETELAARHWDRVRSRDRDQTNNPTRRSQLGKLWPAEWWTAWLAGVGGGPEVLEHVIVRQPSFFSESRELLTVDRLDEWKSWLAFKVLTAAAPVGPQALVDQNFSFYGRTLSGTPQLRERWKRGVGMVESALGEALGQLYVERHFPPESKKQMDELVGYLIAAYRQEIERLSWMSDATKQRALEKLGQFTPKIGYPTRWRDYSTLTIDPADLAGNARRAAAFEVDRELAKIGSPVDRDEWFMTPQTVNAYYNPGMNEIVFPAAILQPPFFDPAATAAANFGAIGAVIGHEIGHGFDDQGAKYDGTGRQHDWWTAEDKQAFEALTAKLIAQYDQLEPRQLPGSKVNGSLTVGENIGDLGGLGIAYQAWRLAVRESGSVLDDPDQAGSVQLFQSWALAWRAKSRDEEALRRLAVDPHSPPEFRCNQVVRNLDEFYRAFDVQPSDGMWLDPADRVRIW